MISRLLRKHITLLVDLYVLRVGLTSPSVFFNYLLDKENEMISSETGFHTEDLHTMRPLNFERGFYVGDPYSMILNGFQGEEQEDLKAIILRNDGSPIEKFLSGTEIQRAYLATFRKFKDQLKNDESAFVRKVASTLFIKEGYGILHWKTRSRYLPHSRYTNAVPFPRY